MKISPYKLEKTTFSGQVIILIGIIVGLIITLYSGGLIWLWIVLSGALVVSIVQIITSLQRLTSLKQLEGGFTNENEQESPIG